MALSIDGRDRTARQDVQGEVHQALASFGAGSALKQRASGLHPTTYDGSRRALTKRRDARNGRLRPMHAPISEPWGGSGPSFTYEEQRPMNRRDTIRRAVQHAAEDEGVTLDEADEHWAVDFVDSLIPDGAEVFDDIEDLFGEEPTP